MSMSDPVADYLTRIRNAQSANKPWVDIPASNLKKRISYVLKEEHFVRDFILIKDDKQDVLRIFLSYDFDKNPVIHGIERVSKPGCRNYVSAEKLPRVLNGMGIAILTTSKGVISNKKAKTLKVGGEILCQVW
jgi:small subunit ribosomal protein S8